MEIKDLTESDIGRSCYYVPGHGGFERGIVKSWNDSVIFVVYPGDNDAMKEHWDRYTAASTRPEDLHFKLPDKKQDPTP